MNDTGFEFVRTGRSGRVGVLRLHRPQALNAINRAMASELARAIGMMEDDSSIGCVMLAGQDKVFCAGADIKEARGVAFPQTLTENYLVELDALARARKPLVAAVAGPALGGGCEIAMMCDLIIAADTARFALPEVKLGVMPGAGGTQRLTQALGKAKALDLCLTGRPLEAVEAERLGLVSRVVPEAELEREAMSAASSIADMSLPAVLAIKEAVIAAQDGLSQGLRLERRLFHSLYATQDRSEGMQAFAEKRAPAFRHS